MVAHFNDDKSILALPGMDEIRTLEEQSSRRERVGVSVAVAGLGLLALIWLGLLARVLLPSQADGSGRDSVATAQPCAAIAEDQMRLRCYDREALHSEPWPAKGAPAPLIFHRPKSAPQLP